MEPDIKIKGCEDIGDVSKSNKRTFNLAAPHALRKKLELGVWSCTSKFGRVLVSHSILICGISNDQEIMNIYLLGLQLSF